jgi:hypothetical protein
MKRVIPKLILFFSCVIFIAPTLAEPSQERVNEFIVNHHRQRQARLLERTSATVRSVNSGRSVSTNWAGALQAPPPSSLFSSVSAQWTLPTLSRPPYANGSGEWGLSTWVGIDGDKCRNSLFQAGAISYVNVSGTDMVNEVVVWYEWIPDAAVFLPDFPVSPGDTIEVSCTAESASMGIVVINNLSKRNSTTITVSAPSKAADLCGKSAESSAEWILEDFTVTNGQTSSYEPFPSFTNVSFSNCAAGTTTGAKVDLYNATLIDLVQSNVTLATPFLVNGTELQISYG